MDPDKLHQIDGSVNNKCLILLKLRLRGHELPGSSSSKMFAKGVMCQLLVIALVLFESVYISNDFLGLPVVFMFYMGWFVCLYISRIMKTKCNQTCLRGVACAKEEPI